MGTHSRALGSASPEHIPEGYYVYLTSGEVATVAPADSMEVSTSELAFRLHGAMVATFPRSQVFSCSRTLQSGPILG